MKSMAYIFKSFVFHSRLLSLSPLLTHNIFVITHLNLKCLFGHHGRATFLDV
jgi:hypothetical protein